MLRLVENGVLTHASCRGTLHESGHARGKSVWFGVLADCDDRMVCRDLSLSFERFPEIFSSASNQRPWSYCRPRCTGTPQGPGRGTNVGDSHQGWIGIGCLRQSAGQAPEPQDQGQHIRYRPATCLTISSASNSSVCHVSLLDKQGELTSRHHL